MALIVLGVALLSSYQWWLPRINAWLIVREVRHSPHVWITPEGVTLAPGVIKGRTYALSSLVLTMPWKDEHAVEQQTEYSLSANYGNPTNGRHDRLMLLLKDPSMRDAVFSQDERAKETLGSLLTSNYKTYEYILNLTPDLQYFSGDDVFSQSMLVLYKHKMLIAGGAISQFETKNGIRGFYAQKNATTTIAEFFTPSDQEYTLIIRGATERELHSILNSLKEEK